MAKKIVAPAEAAPEMPSWFKHDLHRVEPRGIVLAASGDLLAEDGLPVNTAARAALADNAENQPAFAPAPTNASTAKAIEGDQE